MATSGLCSVGGVVVGTAGPRGIVDLRGRYIDEVGLFATYEDGAERAVAGGIELRPLFIARWLSGAEFGNATLDLLVDSFGIELGAFSAKSNSNTASPILSGFQCALGVELPLLSRATGIFIGVRGGLRWADESFRFVGIASSQQSDNVGAAASGRETYVAITLAWHQIFTSRRSLMAGGCLEDGCPHSP